MIAAAHRQGIADALARFGVKEAGLKDWLGGAGRMLIGHPGQAFVEGPRAFSPGGMLSHENVWWPSTRGLTGMQKALPWIQRGTTMMIPLQLMQAAHRDPREGTLSNVLGTAGSLAGMAYGFPALGALGAPILGGIGSRIGHGVGHLLGSRPKDDRQW